MHNSEKQSPVHKVIKFTLFGAAIVIMAILALGTHGKNADAKARTTTIVFKAYHVEAGQHPIPGAVIVIKNAKTGVVITRKKTNGKGQGTVILPTGLKVLVSATGKIGDCATDGLAIFYAHYAHNAVAVPPSNKPFNSPILLKEVSHQNCIPASGTAIGVG